jgi:hypothetical protein
VTVNGSNFQPGAQIVFAGVTLTTTVVSGTEVTALAPAWSSGSVPVLVYNPGPVPSNGGQSITVKGAAPTATPYGGSVGNPVIAQQPNPNPNPSGIWVNLRMPVDSVELRVYSRSLVLVGSTSTGSLQAGWNQVPLPSEFAAGVGNGLFFYKIISHRDGNPIAGPTGGKFYILGKASGSGSGGGGGYW